MKPGAGKPPKDLSSIRDSLRSLREHNASDLKSGPLKGGLAADDQLLIYSFYDKRIAASYQAKLSQQGVLSKVLRRKRTSEVWIDAEDREAAVAILNEHQRQHPDRRIRRLRKEFDYLIFGAAIGLTLWRHFRGSP